MKEYSAYILLNADADEGDIEIAKRTLKDALTVARVEGEGRITLRREKHGVRVSIKVYQPTGII